MYYIILYYIYICTNIISIKREWRHSTAQQEAIGCLSPSESVKRLSVIAVAWPTALMSSLLSPLKERATK